MKILQLGMRSATAIAKDTGADKSDKDQVRVFHTRVLHVAMDVLTELEKPTEQ